MTDRADQLPQALRERTRFTRIAHDAVPGGVPALLAHPEPSWWERAAVEPAPVVLWMHGRTVNKELDPGRYLRWVRAGLAVCAIDMPGHGERFDESMQGPRTSLSIMQRTADHEIDPVLASLSDERFNGAFDTQRAGIGGMSMGGMTALIRLCRAHTFRAASVEAAAGDFGAMTGLPAFAGDDAGGLSALAETLNPAAHLSHWRPIPFLALHSEKDEWIPVEGIRRFVETLRERYEAQGADPHSARLVTWPETGALHEHVGFGRFSNDAKNTQTEFFSAALGAPA